MYKSRKVTTLLVLTAITSGCYPTPTQHEKSTNKAVTSKTAKTCIQNREAYFNLDFEVFDQDVNDGWRKVGYVSGCELAAADLIEEYKFKNQAILETRPKDITSLNWHEGQLRAQGEQVSRAIDLFSKSYSTDSAPEWIPYAEATIAFLNKDMDELKLARDRLKSVPEPEGWEEDVAEMKEKFGMTMTWPPNLNVVTGLINCFDKSYSEAYRKECQKPKPQTE